MVGSEKNAHVCTSTTPGASYTHLQQLHQKLECCTSTRKYDHVGVETQAVVSVSLICCVALPRTGTCELYEYEYIRVLCAVE